MKSSQTENGIFHRIRIFKIAVCMEAQKTTNNQSNIEKGKW